MVRVAEFRGPKSEGLDGGVGVYGVESCDLVREGVEGVDDVSIKEVFEIGGWPVVDLICCISVCGVDIDNDSADQISGEVDGPIYLVDRFGVDGRYFIGSGDVGLADSCHPGCVDV